MKPLSTLMVLHDFFFTLSDNSFPSEFDPVEPECALFVTNSSFPERGNRIVVPVESQLPEFCREFGCSNCYHYEHKNLCIVLQEKQKNLKRRNNLGAAFWSLWLMWDFFGLISLLQSRIPRVSFHCMCIKPILGLAI
ncbi:hypothetical protein, unlikely [Trypanosoma brucei gambiense DAL972]|uniref:Uncharacterized protein n=1 Tax=Trypanosoma brucei gambiense (strain MHOM/CI/86/DAL972) TaxID=679716 RepID=C9ZKS8_TRYB9|nr:hypothetical protein, unlikely [Trypanosoma brucei gambiense DAL972]CBH10294.1 hypothetical protein, unlikely [Trypanosoma brucei gambiense DAL972]|eukprot:XP_011772584.1 hypothetical protein, unlikely [Trypanosoma brucei gambiense DAL972]